MERNDKQTLCNAINGLAHILANDQEAQWRAEANLHAIIQDLWIVYFHLNPEAANLLAQGLPRPHG